MDKVVTRDTKKIVFIGIKISSNHKERKETIKMKKVLFVCSGGMSSAIVEKALKTEAEKANVEIQANAVGSGEAQDAISNNDWDIILVAPQVKNRFETFKQFADAKNIPIVNIPPRDYSPLGGKNLLNLIEK